jgi:hypothetical protein
MYTSLHAGRVVEAHRLAAALATAAASEYAASSAAAAAATGTIAAATVHDGVAGRQRRPLLFDGPGPLLGLSASLLDGGDGITTTTNIPGAATYKRRHPQEARHGLPPPQQQQQQQQQQAALNYSYGYGGGYQYDVFAPPARPFVSHTL